MKLPCDEAVEAGCLILRVQIEETDGVKGKFFLVPILHSFEVIWGSSH